MTHQAARTKVWRTLGAVLMIAAVGSTVLSLRDTSLHADIREVQPPEHFKSGAQRSEALLREIADSLKSIERRLERMEKHADRLAGQKATVAEPVDQRRGRQ